MENLNYERIGRFYGSLKHFLGFGDLWMRIRATDVQFAWYPEKDVMVERFVGHWTIEAVRVIDAAAEIEASSMRDVYRSAVSAKE